MTRGKTLVFNAESGLLPVEVTGVAGADPDVKISTLAQLDGGYIESDKIAKRLIKIKVVPINRSAVEKLRQQLVDTIIPHEDAELFITRNGRTRSIKGRLSGQITVSKAAAGWTRAYTITFVCPQPYLLDEEEQEIVFRQVVPLFTFPLSSFVVESYNPVTETNERTVAGTVTGMMVTTDARYLVNGGDTEIGIRAELEAYAGTVINPWISDGNNKVRVLCQMEVGDILTISTVPGEKYVKLNGVNFMFFDRNSSFFSVPVGVSEISVGADSGTDNLRSRVTYRRKYSGV